MEECVHSVINETVLKYFRLNVVLLTPFQMVTVFHLVPPMRLTPTPTADDLYGQLWSVDHQISKSTKQTSDFTFYFSLCFTSLLFFTLFFTATAIILEREGEIKSK